MSTFSFFVMPSKNAKRMKEAMNKAASEWALNQIEENRARMRMKLLSKNAPKIVEQTEKEILEEWDRNCTKSYPSSYDPSKSKSDSKSKLKTVQSVKEVDTPVEMAKTELAITEPEAVEMAKTELAITEPEAVELVLPKAGEDKMIKLKEELETERDTAKFELMKSRAELESKQEYLDSELKRVRVEGEQKVQSVEAELLNERSISNSIKAELEKTLFELDSTRKNLHAKNEQLTKTTFDLEISQTNFNSLKSELQIEQDASESTKAELNKIVNELIAAKLAIDQLNKALNAKTEELTNVTTAFNVSKYHQLMKNLEILELNNKLTESNATSQNLTSDLEKALKDLELAKSKTVEKQLAKEPIKEETDQKPVVKRPPRQSRISFLEPSLSPERNKPEVKPENKQVKFDVNIALGRGDNLKKDECVKKTEKVEAVKTIEVDSPAQNKQVEISEEIKIWLPNVPAGSKWLLGENHPSRIKISKATGKTYSSPEPLQPAKKKSVVSRKSTKP